MKIGIDVLFLRPGKVGGTESYIKNLIKGLSLLENNNHYYYIFASKNILDIFNINNRNFEIVNCNINNSFRLRRLVYQNLFLPKLIREKKIDLMFFPTYTRFITRIRRVKTISNIHDLQYKHFPKYFSFAKKLAFNIFYPISVKKSDYLISISDFVKKDIIKNYGIEYEGKIKKIYNPIDFDKFNKNVSIEDLKRINVEPKKYLLSVASLLPHKNISTLIKAYKYYLDNNKNDLKLVLVGIKDKSTNNITQLIKKLKLQNSVVIPGFVSDNTLAALYQNALIFISPSLFEGFGMPPVEAMYNKVPVITTKETSLPEVTMNSVFYYNPPNDYKALAKLISKIISNYPTEKELLNLSKKVQQKYSLQKIASEYANLFEEVVSQ